MGTLFLVACVFSALGFLAGWLVSRNNAKRFEEYLIQARQAKEKLEAEVAALKAKAGIK